MGAGDNAHVAGDDEPKLGVAHEVTKVVTAVAQLRGIALQAKEALEVEQGNVVADLGHSHGADIEAWEEAGIEP